MENNRYSRLDLKNKLRQKSLIKDVRKVVNGERLQSPVAVDLDPTTFCDLACPECISSGVLGNGQFSTLRFESLISELVSCGVKAVVLIGGGEPLLHKGIENALITLHNANVKIGIVTNGTMIDRYKDVLSYTTNWLRVSMDAGTSETYKKFRPSRGKKDVFQNVLRGMEAFAKIKRGSLGYSFLLLTRQDKEGVVTEHNYDEIVTAAKLAKSIGCNYFELKAAFDDNHYIIHQPKYLIEILRSAIEEIKNISDFEIIFSSTLFSLIDRQNSKQHKFYKKCPMTELRTTITPNGVYPCAYHRGNDRLKLGDVKKNSFKKMWGSAPTDIVIPAYDCQFHCARHDSNVLISNFEETIQSSEIEDFDIFI